MNIEHWATFNADNKSWTQNPVILLVACGLILGFNFPLIKLATTENIPAFVWISYGSFGSLCALFIVLVKKREVALPSVRQLRYALISGPITFTVPNLAVFFVVPHVGSGFSGIMFALSPVCTILLARLAGMRKLDKHKRVGVAVSMLGACGISISFGVALPEANFQWVLLAAFIPVILAAGNIYRSLDWPADSSPEFLGFWSYSMSFVIYLSLSLISGWRFDISEFIKANGLLISNIALAALFAPTFFRLQRYGGPVAVSQIGYVAAATSVALAAIWLAERYSLSSWLSMSVVFFGLVITVSNVSRAGAAA